MENINVVGRPATREAAYALIDGERDYQELRENLKGWQKNKTVGEWIVLLHHYTTLLDAVWSTSTGDMESLAIVRKIAGIAVHCIEEHGAPARDLKDVDK